MATVVFYEKPGCINNTKQKALLKAAGHQVQAHNLLTEAWTMENLRLFFGNRPVCEWFNRTAPRVKSGEVVPEEIDVETALKLMVEDPILIRRPLIQVGERREMGFDQELIDDWINLQPVEEADKLMSENLMSQDLQTCPNSHQ
ncbi:MAG: nitrogenase-associated protein [Symploca sp. SIO2E9]|nr:nitrogenase-associated protein [Symploca sp. SIO2E9]